MVYVSILVEGGMVSEVKSNDDTVSVTIFDADGGDRAEVIESFKEDTGGYSECSYQYPPHKIHPKENTDPMLPNMEPT